MNTSSISKPLRILVAIVGMQSVWVTGAIASEIPLRMGTPALVQMLAASQPSLQQNMRLTDDAHQFVPPDTGGPDQSGGTGTR